LYLVFLTNTVFSPGFHSSFLKMNGPEPVRFGDWERRGIAVDF
jgi:hypothetical protein